MTAPLDVAAIRARRVVLSSEVDALCDEVERLRAALRRLIDETCLHEPDPEQCDVCAARAALGDAP